MKVPAMTDFRAGGHYHGPDGLNGRVRDGNGCGPASIVAGEPVGGRSRHPGRGVCDGGWSFTQAGPARGSADLRWWRSISRRTRVEAMTRHFRGVETTPRPGP